MATSANDPPSTWAGTWGALSRENLLRIYPAREEVHLTEVAHWPDGALEQARPVPAATTVQLDPAMAAMKLDEDADYLFIVNSEVTTPDRVIKALEALGVHGSILVVDGDPAKAIRALKLRGKRG